MQAFTVQASTVQVLAAQNFNMRITVIFMILAIVVCAMVQESEQVYWNRGMSASGSMKFQRGIGIDIPRRRGWGYQECPMTFLRNICQNIMAFGGQETTTWSYTAPPYETAMPYDEGNTWNYPTTTATYSSNNNNNK